MEARVLCADYFNNPIVLPQSILSQLPSTSTGDKGRKQLPFSENSKCVKRRKTAALRAAYSADELTFAAEMKLREEGKRVEASVLQIVNQSDQNQAVQLLNTSKNSGKLEAKAYSPDEALAMICDTKLTVAQYQKLRFGAKNRHVDLYPSYKRILEAKRNCYPEDSAITVSEMAMDIKLQAILDHTAQRIVLANAEQLLFFSDDELNSITFIVKYGFDGSGDVPEFKQTFSDDDGTKSNGSIFVTSLVPIQATSDTKFLFKNPRPSSTRFCRPVRLQYTKETTELIQTEKAYLDDQIAKLKPLKMQCMGRTITITHKLLMTMVDGKVCNAVTSTKSAQRCYICGATPSQTNDVEAMQKRKANKNTFQFGLSTLHAIIRFFEYFLHLSYRVEIKKWQVRSPDEKLKLAERKKVIQTRFKIEMGLLVDQPRSGGSGNSNDGNTARRFFKNWNKSAEITGLDSELLYRCKIILEALASGCEIDCKKFEEYGLETARRLVVMYPWYMMPVTVHKVLIHGSDIISTFLIPIGQLSEEAQESRNKDVKNYKLNHTRKMSRIATNTDLLHRLLESSDPLISSIRELPKQNKLPLSNEAKQLLVQEDDNSILDSDDEGNNSGNASE